MESVVKRISLIPEDVSAIVASYGPHPKQMYYRHYVRRVSVQWTPLVDGKLRLCIFPNGSEQWVNEQNIHSVKMSARPTGEVDVAAAA